MSTLDTQPKKAKVLNAQMLTIAAIVLIVLALLFLVTPLLRLNGITRSGNFPRTFNGQTFQGGQNGFPGQGNGQTFQGGGNGFQSQGGTNNLPTRQFGARSGLLGGIAGTIVYAIALLISLVAAVGMFNVKRWGKVLGIIMAVFYALLAVIGFLPMLLLARFAGTTSFPSLGLNILHLLLAVAIIVLASLPAKKGMPPAPAVTPPAATA
jgi:hypothetical protein